MTKTDLILHLKTELKLLVPVCSYPPRELGPRLLRATRQGAVSPGLYPTVSIFHMLTPVPPASQYK